MHRLRSLALALGALLLAGVLAAYRTPPLEPASQHAPTAAPSATAGPTPTRTPLPPPSAAQILDRDQAIAYSYQVLLNQTREPGLSYETVLYKQVRLPSGDTGVFVAFGFMGIARGYQLLYRVHGGTAELLGTIGYSRWVWGLASGHDWDAHTVQVPPEWLDLIPSSDGRVRRFLKVAGSGHAGVGLWDEGCFELFDVTDAGLRSMFSGCRMRQAGSNWRARYHYLFRDVDHDGAQEIVKTGDECEMVWHQATGKVTTLYCTWVHETYKFGGDRYVKVR